MFRHAGWGAPSAPGMPGTAPPAPSAWSIPGPGESLSPEPEGAPAPPPKGPPSGPPAAPPRAIPAGTPAYTPQPAWGGAGLPEARQVRTLRIASTTKSTSKVRLQVLRVLIAVRPCPQLNCRFTRLPEEPNAKVRQSLMAQSQGEGPFFTGCLGAPSAMGVRPGIA